MYMYIINIEFVRLGFGTVCVGNEDNDDDEINANVI